MLIKIQLISLFLPEDSVDPVGYQFSFILKYSKLTWLNRALLKVLPVSLFVEAVVFCHTYTYLF